VFGPVKSEIHLHFSIINDYHIVSPERRFLLGVPIEERKRKVGESVACSCRSDIVDRWKRDIFLLYFSKSSVELVLLAESETTCELEMSSVACNRNDLYVEK
jgi:hypothetical protein